MLARLLATLTQHPRQIVKAGVDFQWSQGNSRIWQAFRAFEVIFGRREGIRFEGALHSDGFYIYGTWENFLVHQEGRLRSFQNPFAFKLVPLPALVVANERTVRQNSIFNFAIAFDNAAEVNTAGGNGTTIGGSYTVTGSNPFMMSWSAGNFPGTTSTVTGVTYNSAALSLVQDVTLVADRVWSCWMLQAPSTGSNTLTVSSSNGTLQYLGAISYSGTAQTGQPDASSTASIVGAGVLTGSVTVVASNCWISYMAGERGVTSTANSPGVVRNNGANIGFYDSNAIVPTGSNTCTVTANFTGSSGGMVMVSILSAASAGTAQPYFSLLTLKVG